MHQFLSWNEEGLVALALFGLAWVLQMWFFFRYFLPVARAKQEELPGKAQPVSVIICARNEEKNLMEHVPLIMEQDHPDFELIIVNDSSWDDTEAILKALQIRYPSIHVINLDEEKQNMQGKKFALTLGIKAARHDLLLLTDADCVPSSKDWIRRMTGAYGERTEVVLGFSPYQRTPGWLNRLVRFDTLMTGLHYLGFARAGRPYMGVGRNLSYHREVFFRVGGFKSHYSIASGDDDLFINQVANARNTALAIHPDAQTSSAAKKTWNEWFAQKRRHFTTAPMYKPEDKRLLGLWPLSFFLLTAAGIAALLLNTMVLVVAGMWFLRYVVQMAILRGATVRLGQSSDLMWLAPFLEVHLHVMNTGLYFANLVRKPQKWN